ncbi:MAG: ABC transporter permease subunit [Alphaproteobacteria bacterium]
MIQGNRHDRVRCDSFDEWRWRNDSATGIDDQVALATAHQPDIANGDRIDMRFAEPDYAMVARFCGVPELGKRFVKPLAITSHRIKCAIGSPLDLLSDQSIKYGCDELEVSNWGERMVTVFLPMFIGTATGSIFVEAMFRVPGLGSYFVTSIQTRDYALEMALVLMITMAFSIAFVISDILYALLNPRIRVGGAQH